MRRFVMMSVAALAVQTACAAGSDAGPSAGVPGEDSGSADAGPGGASSDDAGASGIDEDAGASADATAKPAHDAGSGTGGNGGGGNPMSDDAGGGASMDASSSGCTLPAAAQSGIAACDQCQQTNCCAQIAMCLVNNAPCLAIYDCTQLCDDGTYPDGGAFDSTNATLVDGCWNVCEAGQITASTFDSQDNCVSNACATPCQY